MFGKGVKGLVRVNDFFEYVDVVDCIFFPDVGNGDLQEYLRAQGKAVFGCGYAEDIEQKRWETRELFEKLKIPVTKAERIIGLRELREFLYMHRKDEKFIKTSIFRNDFETFKHEDYKLSEPHLDELEYNLGPLKKDFEFIVEDPIKDAVECGIDFFCVDGEYPKHCLFGYEIKGIGYAAVFSDYDKLPKEVTEYNEKIQPTLKELGFSGFKSTEIRVDKKTKVAYPIDMTIRLGSPPNELMQEMFSKDSLAEIVFNGANGVMVDPVPVAKYGIQVCLSSSWYEEGNWQAVYIPDKIRQWVKLVNFTVVDGDTYIIPCDGAGKIGSVIGIGDTLEEAIKNVKEYIPQIKGHCVNACMESIDKVNEAIKEGESIGIKMF